MTKLFFALLVLVVAVYATATEAWEPDSTKALSDLLYIPTAHTFYGKSQMESVNFDLTAHQSGFKVDGNYKSTNFTQTAGFGLSDRWQVSVVYENQFYGRTSFEGNTSSHSQGPANPQLRSLYRLLRQEEDDLTLDLMGGYAPNMFDSKSNANENNRSYASGGSALFLGGRAGKKWTNIEMMGELELTLNGSSETKNSSTKAKDKTDANTQSRLTYWVQLPIQNGVSARAKLERIVTFAHEGKQSDGTKVKYDLTSGAELSGSLLYNLKNAITVEAGVGLLGASDYTIKSGSTKTKFTDVGGTRAFVSALYQF